MGMRTVPRRGRCTVSGRCPSPIPKFSLSRLSPFTVHARVRGQFICISSPPARDTVALIASAWSHQINMWAPNTCEITCAPVEAITHLTNTLCASRQPALPPRLLTHQFSSTVDWIGYCGSRLKPHGACGRHHQCLMTMATTSWRLVAVVVGGGVAEDTRVDGGWEVSLSREGNY